MFCFDLLICSYIKLFFSCHLLLHPFVLPFTASYHPFFFVSIILIRFSHVIYLYISQFFFRSLSIYPSIYHSFSLHLTLLHPHPPITPSLPSPSKPFPVLQVTPSSSSSSSSDREGVQLSSSDLAISSASVGIT